MLACRNSLPPSKGHVRASNWLKLSHTQNSSFKWEGVWETCFQLSSSRTRAGPERRGEWIRVTVHCMHDCVHACVRACMCAVYMFTYVCICACRLHVYVCTCLCACVHVCTCDGPHTAGEVTGPQDQKEEALAKKPSQALLLWGPGPELLRAIPPK